MDLFLGLDAGGTSTQCVLGDETRTLARAHGASIKVIRVTPEQASEALQNLLHEVTQSSGVSLDHIRATCVGISGFHVPVVGNWVRSALGALVSGEVIVCGDDEIAIDAAFPGQSGILVIAGTGSNVVARNSLGQRWNVGGWGPVLADEGSAYWIGHQALRAALRAWDRGEPTMILKRVAELWKVGELWELVEHAHSTPPPDFAALAPVVSACAEEGDAVCVEVLTQAGHSLAGAAILALRKLLAQDPDRHAFGGIAFTGSILQSVGMVRESMIETIRAQAPSVHIVPEAVDPTAGALWRARSSVAPAVAATAAMAAIHKP